MLSIYQVLIYVIYFHFLDYSNTEDEGEKQKMESRYLSYSLPIHVHNLTYLICYPKSSSLSNFTSYNYPHNDGPPCNIALFCITWSMIQIENDWVIYRYNLMSEGWNKSTKRRFIIDYSINDYHLVCLRLSHT